MELARHVELRSDSSRFDDQRNRYGGSSRPLGISPHSECFNASGRCLFGCSFCLRTHCSSAHGVWLDPKNFLPNSGFRRFGFSRKTEISDRPESPAFSSSRHQHVLASNPHNGDAVLGRATPERPRCERSYGLLDLPSCRVLTFRGSREEINPLRTLKI